jgi:hypothetical protein
VGPAPHQIDQGSGNTGKSVGFADVARRITSRTTDFLAVCIVLVASLTLGRQIVVWWHTAPPAESAAKRIDSAPAAWEDEKLPVALEFGDVPVALTRQVCFGQPSAALGLLVHNCESATRAADRPLRERDETENQLLARLATSKPAVEKSGEWQVHVVDDRFLLVAGLRRLSDSRLAEAAGSGWRLVCWGLAMPAGEDTWTTFILRGTGGTDSSPGKSREIPIPPDSRRSLSLKDERGAALVGFSGSGDPLRWMQFYDRWFADRDWTSTEGWSSGQDVWSGRFTGPGDSEPERVEIRFARDRRGELTGLWQVVQPGSVN